MRSCRNQFRTLLVAVAALTAAVVAQPVAAQLVPVTGVTADAYTVDGAICARLCWAGEHEFIYATETVDYGLRLAKRYCVTKADVYLKKVNAMLNVPKNDTIERSDISVSPDGEWAMWRNYYGAEHGIITMRIDGSASVHIPMAIPWFVSWEPGTDNPVCFMPDDNGQPLYGSLRVFDAKTGGLVRAIPISEGSGLSGKSDFYGHAFMPCYHSINDRKAIAVSRYPHIMIAGSRRGRGGAVSLGEYDLVSNSSPTITYSIDLPPKSDLIQAVVSPHEQYVIWQLGFASTTELWVSDMRGNGMRKLTVAKYDPSTSSNDLTDPPISDVTWLPHGGRIACRIGATVYYVSFNIDRGKPAP